MNIREAGAGSRPGQSSAAWMAIPASPGNVDSISYGFFGRASVRIAPLRPVSELASFTENCPSLVSFPHWCSNKLRRFTGEGHRHTLLAHCTVERDGFQSTLQASDSRLLPAIEAVFVRVLLLALRASCLSRISSRDRIISSRASAKRRSASWPASPLKITRSLRLIGSQSSDSRSTSRWPAAVRRTRRTRPSSRHTSRYSEAPFLQTREHRGHRVFGSREKLAGEVRSAGNAIMTADDPQQRKPWSVVVLRGPRIWRRAQRCIARCVRRILPVGPRCSRDFAMEPGWVICGRGLYVRSALCGSRSRPPPVDTGVVFDQDPPAFRETSEKLAERRDHGVMVRMAGQRRVG